MQSLAANRSVIPPDTMELLDRLQAESTQNAAKALHRAVAAQASARRELDKIKTQRVQYLDQWASYIESVVKLLSTQMEEQDKVLEEFASKEAQWTETLQKASSELSKHSASERPDTEVDDERMQASEEMVDQAIEEEHLAQAQRQQQQASRAQLQVHLEALQNQVRAQAQDARREGSRTPRRKTEPVDLTTDDAKDKDKDKAGHVGATSKDAPTKDKPPPA